MQQQRIRALLVTVSVLALAAAAPSWAGSNAPTSSAQGKAVASGLDGTQGRVAGTNNGNGPGTNNGNGPGTNNGNGPGTNNGNGPGTNNGNGQGANKGTGGGASGQAADVLVQLDGTPLAANTTLNQGQTKRVDLGSANTRSARAQLSAIRNDFKRWLQKNAPDAKVTSEFDISLNAVGVALNGTALELLRTAPGVKSVEFQKVYTPLADDPDLALIDAVNAWTMAGGVANAGKGVKVAVIDSGIEASHPCFSLGGGKNKVIVAKVFNMRAKNQGWGAEPGPGQDHGTHVAGTIACNAGTAVTVDGAPVPYTMSGVAPAAELGNYNVFPGPIENARSEDILNALEAAYADGMDVANMSLGGGSNGVQDLLTHAIDDLDEGGMVVAVAAGNSGPGYFTVESPGMGERALTAGAYSVGHFMAVPVNVAGTVLSAAKGDFPLPASALTAPLALVMDGASLGKGCSAVSVPSGSIAVIARGSCTFSQKVANAEAAGAAAVIIVNNVAGAPTAMAITAAFPTHIPAVMIGLGDRAFLLGQNGQSTTMGTQVAYAFSASNNLFMAGFSSQGPTDVDFRVKPDVVAPGVNVLSSVLGGKFAFFSGTSMATPHLAGMAAVVAGAHPTWSAAQVRSAIVNTANRSGLKSFTDGSATSNPLIVGNGAASLSAALGAKLALNPVSTSFGAIPVGNGNTWSRTIDVSVLGGSGAIGCTASGAGYGCSVSGNVITVTYTPREAGPDNNPGRLVVTQGGTPVASSVLFAWGK